MCSVLGVLNHTLGRIAATAHGGVIDSLEGDGEELEVTRLLVGLQMIHNNSNNRNRHRNRNRVPRTTAIMMTILITIKEVITR